MAKKKTAKKKATKTTRAKTAKKVTKKKSTASKKKAAKKSTSAKKTKKVTKKAARKVTKKTTASKKAKKVTKKAAKKVAKKTSAKKTAKKKATSAKKVAKKKVTAKKAAKPEKKVAKKTTAVKAAGKKTTAEKKVVAKKTTASKKKDVAKKETAKAKGKAEEIFEEEEQLDLELTKSEKKTIATEAREKISEGIADLNNEYTLKEIFDAIKTLEFYTSDSDECLARGCENPATTSGYCRFHYISGWKDIKKKQKILEEGQLQQYIEGLVEKYPIKFIESLVSDLTDEKSFFAILKEMDIDADEESYEDIDEGDDDDQDIAFETKRTGAAHFDE